MAKSPIAKKFGIVTGEPIYFAKRKCNNLQIFPVNFSVYHDYSDKLYNLLLEYTDKVYVTTIVSNNEAGFESFNGNIVVSSSETSVSVTCTMNDIILKDTDWFKENREWK